MRYLHQVFIMLYTEDFSMRHYVGFSQIGSHIFMIMYAKNGIIKLI